MPDMITSAVEAVFPTIRLGRVIAEKVMGRSVTVASDAALPAVREETERQENEMRRLEAQAKVAQEMAIANRIENAAEVEIEEFYEYAAEGKAGVNADSTSVSVGVSGCGRRVSKRVYRFSGFAARDIATDLTLDEEK